MQQQPMQASYKEVLIYRRMLDATVHLLLICLCTVCLDCLCCLLCRLWNISCQALICHITASQAAPMMLQQVKQPAGVPCNVLLILTHGPVDPVQARVNPVLLSQSCWVAMCIFPARCHNWNSMCRSSRRWPGFWACIQSRKSLNSWPLSTAILRLTAR